MVVPQRTTRSDSRYCPQRIGLSVFQGLASGYCASFCVNHLGKQTRHRDLWRGWYRLWSIHGRYAAVVVGILEGRRRNRAGFDLMFILAPAK